MMPCYWLLNPPRALDGPVDARCWRRLARSVSALLILFVAMALIGRH